MASTAQNHLDNNLETPAARALMARITRFFIDAIKNLPSADQETALAAQNDILAVIETVARAPASESPELAVRLRGAIARQRLLNDEGGVIGPSRLAELLGISRQAVGQRRASGKLLSIPASGGYVYPIWQLYDSQVLPGLPKVLSVLQYEDPWSTLRFFLNGSLALDGERPLDALRAGRLDEVLRAARLYGEQAAV